METSQPRWPELGRSRISVPEHVVFRALAEETILLNVQSGRYHGLDAFGARFFDVLREAGSIEDARDALVAEYGQSPERIEKDLVGFCDTMQRLGLLELE